MSIVLSRRWLIALLSLAPTRLPAQEPRLGTITFPTSAGHGADERFIRGLLYLHSFEYDAAAAEFRQAQHLAPGFGLAYWGEAMTYNHPIWDEQDRGAALAALARLAPTPAERARKVSSERDRAWLEAVEVLYGEGSKIQRDTLYGAAMERLASRYPDDLEARTFFALSLMGLSQGTRVIPTYMRAGAIALDALRSNSDHPGAAHYVIHAFDDPIHAPIGLPAARAYSAIAPQAAHAQHMTTHIFLALGMWDEVVQQNIIASGPNRSTWMPGHYTSWLGYGLLQQGRMEEARAHLELVRRNLSAGASPGRRGSLMFMRAHHLINTEAWQDTALLYPIDRTGVSPVFTTMDDFALGYARYNRGELVLVREAIGRMSGGVLKMELEAILKLAAGDTLAAVQALREASAMEDTLPLAFGPPDIIKPSHELLGEVQLQLGRAAEARNHFQRSLALAPKRTRSLLGLYRAAVEAGDTVVARQTLADLKAVLHRADPALPELVNLGLHQGSN